MNIAFDNPNAKSCLSHEAGRAEGEGEAHFIEYPVIRLTLVGRGW